ncbi:MAG: hypothetical protein ACI87W_003410 [Halieaceae bacterium]|jgi:hypothetical protein
MQRFKKLSLSLQLPLVAAGCALLVGMALVWLAATSSSFLESEREKLYGEALAAQIAARASEALESGDLLSVRASLQRFVDSSMAGGVSIRDVEGRPMSTAGSMDSQGAEPYRAPILLGTDLAGEVLLTLDASSAEDNRRRALLSLLALAGALSLLVFMLTRRFAQRLSTALLALQSQLALPSMEPGLNTDNELDGLLRTVEQLPMEMLRGHAPIPIAATEFRESTVLFVHLASLTRYVDTLGESNLHRYTRRLQQLVCAAAQCYGGRVSVTRSFGMLITFTTPPGSTHEALRAASCARLIALVAQNLEARIHLSLELAMALGRCERSPDQVDDMYPELYLQGVIDELRDVCLVQTEFPQILLAEKLLDDDQLGRHAQVNNASNVEIPAACRDFSELICLSEEQENLLTHQAQLIAQRIKPSPPEARQGQP